MKSLQRLLVSTSRGKSKDAAQSALHIYRESKVQCTDSGELLNVVMKILIREKQQHHLLDVWDDIIIHESSATPTISQSLVLRCLFGIKPQNDNVRQKCIYALKLIDNTKMLNEYSSDIIHLISTSNNEQEMETIASVLVNHEHSTKRIMDTLLRNHQYQRLSSLYDSIQNIKPFSDDTMLHSIIQSLINDHSKSNHIPPPSNEKYNLLMSIYNHFKSLPSSNQRILTLNALMTTFIHNGNHQNALSLYSDDSIQTSRNMISHLQAINVCIELDHLQYFEFGKRLRNLLFNSNDSDPSNSEDIRLKNALINFYGHYDDVNEAVCIFESITLDQRTVITINTMMKMLIQQQQYQRALSIFDECIASNHHAKFHDDSLFVLALKACARSKDYQRGRMIHDTISKSKFIKNGSIQMALIDFYGHCKDITTCYRIFADISESDKSAINIGAMMMALIHHEHYQDALDLYHLHPRKVDDICTVSALRACAKLKNTNDGHQIIQRLVAINGFMNDRRNNNLINGILDFYGSIGDLNGTKRIFDEYQWKQSDALNRIMNIYLDHNNPSAALDIYDDYGSLRDDKSHVLAIKACSDLKDLQRGKMIVNQLNKIPIQITNAVLDLYTECNVEIDEILDLFHCCNTKDVVTVNTMMKAFISRNMYSEALDLYNEYSALPEWEMNDISHVLAIKSCTNMMDVERGKKIHLEISKVDGLSSGNVKIDTALIQFYGKIKDIGTALKIFHCISSEQMNVVTINVMMDVCCERNVPLKCIEIFERYILNGNIAGDLQSFVTVLKACTQSTSYHFGHRIHNLMQSEGEREWMLKETEIQMHLINLYGKCGNVMICEAIFERADRMKVDIWNAMIGAYGRNGEFKSAKKLFDWMRSEEIAPDRRVYISMLIACVHCGEADIARDLWESEISMDEELCGDPYVVTAVIDCLAKGGHLKEAKDILFEFHQRFEAAKSHESMWLAMLSACRTCIKEGDVDDDEAVMIMQKVNEHFRQRF